ncbi:MAG: dihydrofolate reductase family protein [Methanomassiliicoccales archaeon]
MIALKGKERKVVLFIASSLDGFIAGKDGDIGWLFTDQDYGYSDFLAGIDSVIMGRRTYDQLLGMGDFPYRGKECYVFSRSVMGGDDNVEFVNKPVNEFVEELKASEGNDIWLVGGSELIWHFLKAGLIDEFVISVHPFILGDGIPLFRPDVQTHRLRHIKTQVYSSGLVQMNFMKE